jgi:hypothetical protein
MIILNLFKAVNSDNPSIKTFYRKNKALTVDKFGESKVSFVDVIG